MNTKKYSFRPAMLILLLVALVSYACSRVEDNTRGSSLLIVEQVTGQAGGEGGGGNGEEGTPLLSDTCDSEDPQLTDPDLCPVFNDNALITFGNNFLGGIAGGTASFLNDIIVNRYRVDYFRSNSRNIPGVDVPYAIDGTMNFRVAIEASGEVSILVVRHVAKLEPPLSDLSFGISEEVITANAELRFWGQDLAGRTVTQVGYLEIHWANYGEE